MSFPILKDEKNPRHVRNTGTREDMELKKELKGARSALAQKAMCRFNAQV
jgi:hypothetical protein